MTCPVEFLKGLRAIFILPGTKKQFQSRNASNIFYGHYWNSCVYLHAYPFETRDLDKLCRFYIRNVLMHEIGHHVDTLNVTRKDRERFAEQFARIHG